MTVGDFTNTSTALTAEARMGDRKEVGEGRRPADHLLRPRRDVLAASGEGLTVMVNSIGNGWRTADVWLDKLAEVQMNRKFRVFVVAGCMHTEVETGGCWRQYRFLHPGGYLVDAGRSLMCPELACALRGCRPTSFDRRPSVREQRHGRALR
jgi:hypothetical protein